MQAENITRRANARLLIFGVFLQILCYCEFPLSHCHQYCHHRRIRPCMVPERAPTDVLAILHVQKFGHAHAGMAMPTCRLSPIHCSPASPLASPHRDLVSSKTSPKLLLPDRETRLVRGYRGSLPATCLGAGSPPQAIEPCPAAEVWAHGSMVFPFVPFSLWNSFFFFSSLSDHLPAVSLSHFQATAEIPSSRQIATGGRKTQFLKVWGGSWAW